MNRKSRILCSVSVFLLSISIAMNPCQALEQTEYSLRMNVSVSSPIPFQTVSPINVKVELTNVGYETFNGTLTITGRTEDESYSPIEYPISNLNINSTMNFFSAFRTNDVGTYWITVRVESNQSLSNIKLYQDSIFKSEGHRVGVTESIFIHSFTEFIMIIGVSVATILAVVGILVQRKRKRHGARAMKTDTAQDLSRAKLRKRSKISKATMVLSRTHCTSYIRNPSAQLFLLG
jgi:hypothetical protein